MLYCWRGMKAVMSCILLGNWLKDGSAQALIPPAESAKLVAHSSRVPAWTFK